jgi:isopropylmalate/homocitrate/citramalate synthase
MDKESKHVTLKDSTLREGLDTPGVNFSTEQALRIAKALDQAGVPELEIVAPARVMKDLEFARRLRREELRAKTSGLVYANRSDWEIEIEAAAGCLDRFDVLIPLSAQRKPFDRKEKSARMSEALDFCAENGTKVGVGFPHSTQVELDFLLEIAAIAIQKGANRITIYDTNGTSDPFAVQSLIGRLRQKCGVAIFFHGHNDLGLAVANSLAAVFAGADGLDVTVNGLGDRAGNASLEQVAMAFYVKGFRTGIDLENLTELSRIVEEESGVRISKLAPVVGEFILSHRSASHQEVPEVFEAFDPQVIGSRRKLTNP